jgi:uncharacterized phage-associated protein
MAKAYDVAKYFIRLAGAEDEPDPLSHLRVQKLLYYAQGWSLALRKKPLFHDKIEAWPHGPVVPNVYNHFSKYKSDVIPADKFNSSKINLTKDERELVQAVWNEYKKFSAIKLREMTHKEPPWKETRKGREAGERSTKEITQTDLKKYFLTLAT